MKKIDFVGFPSDTSTILQLKKKSPLTKFSTRRLKIHTVAQGCQGSFQGSTNYFRLWRVWIASEKQSCGEHLCLVRWNFNFYSPGSNIDAVVLSPIALGDHDCVCKGLYGSLFYNKLVDPDTSNLFIKVSKVL